MFNYDSYPIRFPYKLIKWGPYKTPDNHITIGVELLLFLDENKFKTLFIVSDKSSSEDIESLYECETKVIEAFKKIDFNQYLKCIEWKET